MLGLIQAILALDPTINRPPRQTVPPAQILGRYMDDFVQRQLLWLGLTGPAASEVQSALRTVIGAIQVPVHNFLQAHQAAQQLYGWWMVQSAHRQAVEIALVNGLVKGLNTESHRFQAVKAERGEFIVTQHLAIALGSPLPQTPAGVLFWTSAICHWVAQGVMDYWELLRLVGLRPDEGIVLLLQMSHVVLSLAFSPHGQALKQAEELGTGLAHNFAEELYNAVFPSLGTATVLGSPLRRFLGPGPLLVASAAPGVDRVISPFLVPWTLGAFVGPLLVDIALAILAPEVGWLRATTIVVSRRFRLIREVLDKMEEVAARVQRGVLGHTGGTHLPPSSLSPVSQGLVDPPRTPSSAPEPHAFTGIGSARPAGALRPVPTVGTVSGGMTLAAQGREAVRRGASIIEEKVKLARRFADMHPRKLDSSNETTRGLADIFRRILQEHQPTGAEGELVTIERYLNNRSVTGVKVIPPQSRTKSPDLEIRYRGGIRERVEIKSITVPNVTDGRIWDDIRRKVEKRQLGGQRGAIMIVVEHPPDDFGEVAKRAIERIRETMRDEKEILRYYYRDSKWRNIRRIEIAPGVGPPLIFDRAPAPDFFRLRRR